MYLSMFSPRMAGGGGGWGGDGHTLGIRQPKQSLPLGIWQTTLAQGRRHLRCFSEKTEEIMKLCLNLKARHMDRELEIFSKQW